MTGVPAENKVVIVQAQDELQPHIKEALLAPEIQLDPSLVPPPTVDPEATMSPVVTLLELCAKRHITPKYALVEKTGFLHNPRFKYQVVVSEYTQYGIGSSKKKAKSAAANNMLAVLIGSLDAVYFGGDSESEKDELNGGADGMKQTDYGKYSYETPISMLNRFCSVAYRQLPYPIYIYTGRVGVYPDLFTYQCRVGEFSVDGSGSKKRKAMQAAAGRMLSLLAEREGVREEPIIVKKIGKAPFLVRFHKKLLVGMGMKAWQLSLLSLDDPGFDYVQFLQKVANEGQFGVTYVDLGDGCGGEKQFIVQVATEPVTVCYGRGETQEDAMKAGARQALQLLKAMVMAIMQPEEQEEGVEEYAIPVSDVAEPAVEDLECVENLVQLEVACE